MTKFVPYPNVGNRWPPKLPQAGYTTPISEMNRGTIQTGWITVQPKIRVYPLQLYWDGFRPTGHKEWYIKLSNGQSVQAGDANFARWYQKLKARSQRGCMWPQATPNYKLGPRFGLRDLEKARLKGV